MANQWFSIVEYAREFNISDMTIRRRIKTGKLNAVLKDGKYYIPVTQAEASKLKQMSHNHEEEFEFAPEEQDFVTNMKAGNSPSIKNHTPTSNIHHSYKRPIQNAEYQNQPSMKFTPKSNQTKRNSHYEPQTSEALNSKVTRQLQRNSEIPTSVLDTLSLYEKSLVDTENLLQFCESSLQLMQKMETKLQEQFEQKLENLELEIKNKNQEITQLQQQLEDLQVLVKILEKKNV